MKKLIFVLFVVVFGVPSARASYLLVLNVNGISCTTVVADGITQGVSLTSWDWGATTAISGSNGNEVLPGKLSLSQVVTARATDKCSPAYLSANLTGQILDTVTITQYAVIGGKPEAQMIVTLTNALLAKYSISGSTAANPVESLSWAFQKICLNNVLNTTTACYNATTNQPSD